MVYLFLIFVLMIFDVNNGDFWSSGFGPMTVSSALLVLATHSAAIWLASEDQRATEKTIIRVINGIGLALTVMALILAIQKNG